MAGIKHVVAIVALIALVSGSTACSKPPQEDTPTVPEFQKRIDAYMAVQKKVIGDLPALKNTDDPNEITSREIAMGDAVRRARSDAKPGDLIPPETATYFRKLIQEDLRGRTEPEKKVMKDELPPFEPVVNQRYPPEHPLATFPATLLKILPTLPPELEYRFVANTLIIRDVKTNIIIDYVPNVF